MQKKLIISIYILIAGLVIWGFINPSGIRAAVANNTWSNDYVKTFFTNPDKLAFIPPPPSTHKHAGIFMVKQALFMEDYDAAIQYITPLVETRDPVMLGIYAEVLYRQGEYESAFAIWEEIGDDRSLWRAAGSVTELGSLDLRVAAGKSLYAINPETYASFYTDSLLKIPDFQTSIAVLTETMNNFPNSENLTKWSRVLSRAYFEQGESYRSNGQLDQAEEQYYLAINANSSTWKAWKSLGFIYYSRDKNVETAIECFRKVMEITPESGEGFREIGEIYIKENQISTAIDWYSQASKLYPNTPRLQITYANLLRDNGQTRTAVEVYQSVLQQYPEEKQVNYELARTYHLLGQTNEAMETIQQAIAFRSDVPAYFILAAQIFEQKGFIEEALNAYKQALQLDPDNGYAKDSITRLTHGN